ncbi:NAD(P)-dependent malic enzyme [Desulfitobacterium sp.]|uniref:NAD(P)-dependent malic enzyme n=1 Tax=Desulfitobacterium sp. TaxID=49981 RepID=UPI002C001475|nr:malic enzyme-like NAD(P)-binding protein [Desulfitobacterium sp.]HVJ50757.1 malic enzyme-like NAD(P)-binding protein [Desulfitobacterium sp.]
MSTIEEESLELHREKRGKLGVYSKVDVKDAHDLALAYSPGVAEPCKQIQMNSEDIYTYTNKGNFVGVISNGTAVLGLGNIGAWAAMPVMEGKAVLFKKFAGIDAFPICLNSTDTDKIVETVKMMEPCFGGINLEDIGAPACFEIEERLKKEMSIPVFHDDQHGTAIVVMAGLINALKLINKKFEEIKVVTNGAGAAGVAIIKLLMSMGVKNVIMCDSKGAIYEGRPIGMNKYKDEIALVTNRQFLKGSLADALVGADVFIGVSVANTVTQEMVKSMAKAPIIFAMANPVPEIMPDLAKEAGAKVIGTGRSDMPNQINNVSAFPGIFRGALDVRAKEINEEMKIAAAYAIASLVSDDELNTDYIVPKAFDPRLAPTVAAAVSKAAMDSGVARIKVDPAEIFEKVRRLQETR